MLYLLESSEYYKVGFTLDEETLDKRLKHYKTHNPEFNLLSLYEGGREEELYIHNQCSEFLHYGEWFKKNKFVLECLEKLNRLEESGVERFLLKIVGNNEYFIPEDNINKEVYAYHVLVYNEYIIRFYIFNNNSMLVIINNSLTTERKEFYFYNQVIKSYYCDYSKKSKDRKFYGILFESGYILLTIKEKGKVNVFEETSELIHPNIENIYNCFTRKNFKIINLM